MIETSVIPHVIITGTTKGLGFYLCQLYLSKGYCVTGFARSEAPTDFDEFQASYRYKHIVSDLCKPSNIANVFAEYKNRKSKIIILNAADYSIASEESSQSIADQLNLNIIFPLGIIDKVLFDSKKTNSEVKIVFISSIMACIHDRTNPAYGAAKAAVSEYINSLQIRGVAPVSLLNVISGPLLISNEAESFLKKLFSTRYADAAEKVFRAAQTNDNSIHIGAIWKYTIGILSLLGKKRMSILLNNFR